MIATGMGYSVGLMKLVLALTFTAVQVQAQCEQPEFVQLMTCIFPYIKKFSPLSDGSCHKERISKDICNDFEMIAECVIRNKISPECLEAGESEKLKQFGFFCTVPDFQERCPNAPIIKTGQTNGAGGAAGTRGSVDLLLVTSILLFFILTQSV